MAREGTGLHEERTRVMCHLPLNDSKEEKALNQVIKYLKELRQDPVGVKGFTHSPLRAAAFRGYWWSAGLRRYMKENVVLFIIDFKLDFDDERLSDKLVELKEQVQHWYAHYTGKRQEVVWVVAHPIKRLD